jgi:hypothetical protein
VFFRMQILTSVSFESDSRLKGIKLSIFSNSSLNLIVVPRTAEAIDPLRRPIAKVCRSRLKRGTGTSKLKAISHLVQGRLRNRPVRTGKQPERRAKAPKALNPD